MNEPATSLTVHVVRNPRSTHRMNLCVRLCRKNETEVLRIFGSGWLPWTSWRRCGYHGPLEMLFLSSFVCILLHATGHPATDTVTLNNAVFDSFPHPLLDPRLRRKSHTYDLWFVGMGVVCRYMALCWTLLGMWISKIYLSLSLPFLLPFRFLFLKFVLVGILVNPPFLLFIFLWICVFMQVSWWTILRWKEA